MEGRSWLKKGALHHLDTIDSWRKRKLQHMHIGAHSLSLWLLSEQSALLLWSCQFVLSKWYLPVPLPLPISWLGTEVSLPNRIIIAWDGGGEGCMRTSNSMITLSRTPRFTIQWLQKQTNTEAHRETTAQTQTICELHQGHSFRSELWDMLTSRASPHSHAE